jgi:3-oxoadipate enol-lactonase
VTAPLAVDRAGPTGDLPVLLLHAGVADRRMWDPLWPDLTSHRDAVRLDLRGFGASATRPDDGWSHVTDVAATLDALAVARAHVAGCSLGAGVAVELALRRPDLVASLLLVAPGGSLLTRTTDELRAFVRAEDAALAAGDLDAAAQVDVDQWLVSPRRPAAAVDAGVRALVHAMQRRAFEVTAEWGEVQEDEPDPPPTARLGEIDAPTLVLTGGLDLDAVGEAADAVVAGVRGARRVRWDGVAHLPSLERPVEFTALLRAWLAEVGAGRPA